MSWFYSLSAECGPDRNRAEVFAKRFDRLSFKLLTGKTSLCSANVHSDEENNWWADIFPSTITQSNGSSLTDAIEVSEVGFRLYRHLKSSPQFRFALFGCEVQEFRLYSQLADEVTIRRDGRIEFDNHSAFEGLVLSVALWEELGKPITFFPFAPGYVWRLYGGKEHSVISDDAEYGTVLRELQTELYPKWGRRDQGT